MATHANSTPAPSGYGGLIRLRHNLTHGQEFLRLMDLERRVAQRLDEVVDLFDPQPVALPLSGLREIRPSALLFKGRRDAS